MEIIKVPRGFKIDKSPAIADLNAIEDVIEEDITDNAVANNLNLTGTAVTAGKLWVITVISAVNVAGTVERITIFKLINAVSYHIISKATLVKHESVDFYGILVLNAGEELYVEFAGCQGATDACFFSYLGYQIDKY